MSKPDIKQLLKNQVLIFDGGLGTSIAQLNLTPDDYQGYEGCNEYLTISRPDVIKRIHTDFFEAGCDIVETNTFGANEIVLAKHQLSNRVYELNKKAAELAKRVADRYSTRNQPRFVSGAIGPGTKLPSLRQITFDKLKNSACAQALGLIDGGVDILQIETCQDVLQAKAALQGVLQARKEKSIDTPIIVQVTMEQNGKMLLGTDISAVIAAFSSYDLFALGLNCSTGPEDMKKHVQILSKHSPFNISVLPNAGLPKFIDGRHQYDLAPKDFANQLAALVQDYGINLAGGCCGTTTEHLKALVQAVKNITPKKRYVAVQPSFSSLYQAQEYDVKPRPLIIGERANATGNKQFREKLLAGDLEGLVDIALEQQEEGAHLVDVAAGYAGQDEIKNLTALAIELNTKLRLPISLDSTNAEAIEQALKKIAGKSLINSVNLEDEEKTKKLFQLAKDFGAAVICLAIDQQGMAETTERKLEISEKLYKMATEEFGINPENIFFDTLTFTLASGDSKYYNAALKTLNAIKNLKATYPESHTILGLSNVSYGLKPEARKVLNSVFLYHAVKYGLDCAILHAAKIIPINQISEKELRFCEDLIFNKRTDSYDPLQELIKFFEENKSEKQTQSQWEGLSLEKKLKGHIITGRKAELEQTITSALQKYQAIEIINNFILRGMREVGELFGEGKMQLPFVLQAAETTKKAVDILRPYLNKTDNIQRGAALLATVKGDVHDIGKNLVDIIVANNGYKIYNIGVDQSAEEIAIAYEKYKPDIIGLSGLLVKSTESMNECLKIFNEKNITVPVVCGGAALTPEYTKQVLQKTYKGRVYYAKDAFDLLRIVSGRRENIPRRGSFRTALAPSSGRGESIRTRSGQKETEKQKNKKTDEPASATKQPASRAASADKEKLELSYNFPVPKPPFWGTQITKDIPLREVLPYLNELVLFAQRWKLQKTGQTRGELAKLIKKQAKPALRKIIKKAEAEKLLGLKTIHGHFPCYSRENTLVILDPQDKKTVLAKFNFLRQKTPPCLSLAKYFRPRQKNEHDLVSFYIVTVGKKANQEGTRLFKNDHYKDYLYWHGFTVQLAESLAEYIHHQIRLELKIDQKENQPKDGLWAEKYQGQRYSFGYPACPDLADQKKLFALLKPQDIGVTLTENYQLVPEQSTSGLVVYHPRAGYFKV